MSYGKTPKQIEELRMWAAEQAVEYTKRKDHYVDSGAVTRVADVLYQYVTTGKVQR